jgi:hypothetical protein
VSVSLLAGGRVFSPETTDAAGTFRFTDVPAGDVIVTPTMAGYNPAMIRRTLASSAGEYPLGNGTLTLGPIGLLPQTESFAFRVLDPLGQPVSGYPVGIEVQVQFVDFATGVPDAEGQIFQQVQTDPDGYAIATGLPDFFALGSATDAVLVFLPPYDGDGDGVPEFPGGDAVFNLRSLDPTPDVVLDEALAATLTVRASTIGRLSGAAGETEAVLQTTDSVHVTFNLPIRPQVTVELSDEQGAPIDVPGANIAVRDDTLSIALSGLGLAGGAEYNLALHAVAAVGDRQAVGDFAAPFFTVPPMATVSASGTMRDGAQLVTLAFSEPVGGLGTSLTGGDCVVYFAFDINGANGQGDYPNELGSASCDVQLFPAEWDPPGLPGGSGYTTRWQFYAPVQPGSGAPLPGGTGVHFLFDRVVSAPAVMQRADGRAVQNLTFALP